MTQKKYDMVIVEGEYTNAQGETKKRYKNIGAVMQSDNGFFALLDPGVNLAAYKEQGRDRVMVSLYEPRNNGQQQGQAQQNTQAPQRQAPADDFGDDQIPF
jgi:hypothetical protein